MKRASIRVQEPTPELIEKIRRARVAISQQKPRYLKCPYCQHIRWGEYSPKIHSIHPLGANGANLACKQNRKMVKSANCFFAHWRFRADYGIMWLKEKSQPQTQKEARDV